MAFINAAGKSNKQRHSGDEFNIRTLVSHRQSATPPKLHLASLFAHYSNQKNNNTHRSGKKKKAAIHP